MVRDSLLHSGCFDATILIVLSFTHVAPIKEKLGLEESQYCKRCVNTFQKMGTEFLLANGGKGMWFDSQQLFVGRSVERQH